MITKNLVRYSVITFLLCIGSVVGTAQLKATFNADQLSGCAPLLVNFTDASAGNPTEWHWDLGNGSTSFLQNPSVAYFTPGQYTIKLIVKNANGADSIIKIKYISVNAIPDVAFDGNQLAGCHQLKVQFSDVSNAGTGAIDLWKWDFGDGTMDAKQNPQHTYTNPGNFNVTLQVRNSVGCTNTITKTKYVKVGAGAAAKFTNNISPNCKPPAIINFQNLSTGSGILSYNWDFGDGSTSTEANPSHNYTTAGYYTVKLIATSNEGCTDTLVKNNAVLIGSVVPSFTNKNSVCANEVFTLTNTSFPAPSSVLWDFGDGTTSILFNPQKSFATSGIYPIKLITTLGNCTDSIIKNITVVSKPDGSFTSNLTGCSNYSISFTNTTLNAVSYLWDFGDGTATSVLPNPVHQYNSSGVYNVTLISTNSSGCSDIFKKAVQVYLPKATIINLPDSGCAPMMKKFTATVNSPIDNVASYLWDFGDGSTSAEVSPTHNFNAGVYTIKLIITTDKGCKDTATLVNGIIATEKPLIDFVANPTNVCAYVPIQFTDKTIGNVTKWLWRFGDYDTSTQKNPIHVYRDTGYMNVQLKVWNRGCTNMITFPKYIYIKPPIARFNYGYSCSNPYIKYFFQFSIGGDEWIWDFGDGTTSKDKNPIHHYPAPGVYTVVLTVKSNITGCSYATSRLVSVIIEKAGFTASNTAICKKETVTFTALGMNNANILLYCWDLGDGTIDTGKIIKHTYTEKGDYTVRLILINKLWCRDTLTKQFYIRVNGPTANFTPSLPGNCIQSAVVFKDNSTNDGVFPIVTWNWNYGDGTSESLAAPPFKHTYTNAGLYPVFLQVIDANGCKDSMALGVPLIVSKPKANFAALTTLSCPNKEIGFKDSCVGLNLQYTWYFGDGATSNIANPVHHYTKDGLYSIKLVVTDEYGCTDSAIRLNYIKINTPYANFTMSDSLGTCSPLLINFTNTSVNYKTINWDFGDGTYAVNDNPSHFYSTPGMYYAKLTIESEGGCIDTIKKQISVFGPSGNFSYGPVIGCTPTKIKFASNSINAATFLWDFNDGFVVGTKESTISHTYTVKGYYVPKMILIDSSGCRLPLNGLDTIHIKEIAAGFTYSKKLFCGQGTVQFYDSTFSDDVIVKRQWDFDDGATSSDKNPEHFYSNTGIYYPKLITTTLNGCTDTATYSAPIKIIPIPQSQIVSKDNGCTPLNITFNGQLLVQDTAALTWNWDFANGATSNVQNPPATIYNIASNYAIKLIVTNSSGCADTVVKNIAAYPIPKVKAGADEIICFGTGVVLNATGADSYSWIPSTNLSCADCQSPLAKPDSLTNFIVKGTSNGNGCTSTDTVQIRVKHPFVLNNSLGDTLCVGSSKKLFAAGGYKYVWSPATGLSDANSATPIASPNATTLYTVISTDEKGCFKDTGYVPITVYSAPTINAGQDKTIIGGETATLPFVYTGDAASVTWAADPSILEITANNITVKPLETTEYTVEVKSKSGCKAKDKVTVFVICSGANVFIPNTFSPNGDGANDKFYPRGKGLFRVKAFRIFNRWGELVFMKNDFMPNDENAGWDGTYKGQRLNPDVYVYTVDIQCNSSNTLALKGNITLIR